MRGYDLPGGGRIDLDAVKYIGKLFINKNYPQYNSYEIYLSDGKSHGIFESIISRADFILAWEA